VEDLEKMPVENVKKFKKNCHFHIQIVKNFSSYFMI